MRMKRNIMEDMRAAARRTTEGNDRIRSLADTFTDLEDQTAQEETRTVDLTRESGKQVPK